MLPVSKANLEELRYEVLNTYKCKADVLRLDTIHPVVSGNKWFKLKYNIQKAIAMGKRTILTFGGAYSNHIIATAYAAKIYDLQSIGIIRGEQTGQASSTLTLSAEYGMKHIFVSRESYRAKAYDPPIAALIKAREDIYVIPEGGAGELGEAGCREILQFDNADQYTHIMAAMGTGTTYKGILEAATTEQQVIGIPVLKGMQSAFEHLSCRPNAQLFYEYHGGGYAKKSQELLEFMNSFYEETNVPTDFVYTGKLMFAFNDLLKNGYFKPGSKILLIHSGGLQGNNSLRPGTLVY